ncbi:MAG: hypothetical protein R8M45_03015 [Ghiorsea sp.]
MSVKMYLGGTEFQVHPNDVERLKKQGFKEEVQPKKSKDKVSKNGN